MFGHRFFGARYFGVHYFGPALAGGGPGPVGDNPPRGFLLNVGRFMNR